MPHEAQPQSSGKFFRRQNCLHTPPSPGFFHVYVYIHVYNICVIIYTYVHTPPFSWRNLSMLRLPSYTFIRGEYWWLRLVGSLKLQVSFAKEPYKRDYILRTRPVTLRSLLICLRTPPSPGLFHPYVYIYNICIYIYLYIYIYVHIYTYIRIYMHIFMCIHLYVCTGLYMFKCMCVHTLYVNVYVRKCIYVYKLLFIYNPNLLAKVVAAESAATHHLAQRYFILISIYMYMYMDL